MCDFPKAAEVAESATELLKLVRAGVAPAVRLARAQALTPAQAEELAAALCMPRRCTSCVSVHADGGHRRGRRCTDDEGIGERGARALAAALAAPRRCVRGHSAVPLLALNCGGNAIGDRGVQALAAALCSPAARLHTLRLAGCDTSDAGAAALGAALARGCPLTALGLDKNAVGDEGAAKLADGLASPRCRLKLLSLRANAIGSLGAISLAEAALAREQASLHLLDLRHCRVGRKGREALEEVVAGGETALVSVQLAGQVRPMPSPRARAATDTPSVASRRPWGAPLPPARKSASPKGAADAATRRSAATGTRRTLRQEAVAVRAMAEVLNGALDVEGRERAVEKGAMAALSRASSLARSESEQPTGDVADDWDLGSVWGQEAASTPAPTQEAAATLAASLATIETPREQLFVTPAAMGTQHPQRGANRPIVSPRVGFASPLVEAPSERLYDAVVGELDADVFLGAGAADGGCAGTENPPPSAFEPTGTVSHPARELESSSHEAVLAELTAQGNQQRVGEYFEAVADIPPGQALVSDATAAADGTGPVVIAVQSPPCNEGGEEAVAPHRIDVVEVAPTTGSSESVIAGAVMQPALPVEQAPMMTSELLAPSSSAAGEMQMTATESMRPSDTITDAVAAFGALSASSSDAFSGHLVEAATEPPSSIRAGTVRVIQQAARSANVTTAEAYPRASAAASDASRMRAIASAESGEVCATEVMHSPPPSMPALTAASTSVELSASSCVPLAHSPLSDQLVFARSDTTAAEPVVAAMLTMTSSDVTVNSLASDQIVCAQADASDTALVVASVAAETPSTLEKAGGEAILATTGSISSFFGCDDDAAEHAVAAKAAKEAAALEAADCAAAEATKAVVEARIAAEDAEANLVADEEEAATLAAAEAAATLARINEEAKRLVEAAEAKRLLEEAERLLAEESLAKELLAASEREKAEHEIAVREERERLLKEKAELEAAAQAERERLEAEKAELEAKAKTESERLAAEKEALAKEKLDLLHAKDKEANELQERLAVASTKGEEVAVELSKLRELQAHLEKELAEATLVKDKQVAAAMAEADRLAAEKARMEEVAREVAKAEKERLATHIARMEEEAREERERLMRELEALGRDKEAAKAEAEALRKGSAKGEAAASEARAKLEAELAVARAEVEAGRKEASEAKRLAEEAAETARLEIDAAATQAVDERLLVDEVATKIMAEVACEAFPEAKGAQEAVLDGVAAANGEPVLWPGEITPPFVSASATPSVTPTASPAQLAGPNRVASAGLPGNASRRQLFTPASAEFVSTSAEPASISAAPMSSSAEPDEIMIATVTAPAAAGAMTSMEELRALVAETQCNLEAALEGQERLRSDLERAELARTDGERALVVEVEGLVAARSDGLNAELERLVMANAEVREAADRARAEASQTKAALESVEGRAVVAVQRASAAAGAAAEARIQAARALTSAERALLSQAGATASPTPTGSRSPSPEPRSVPPSLAEEERPALILGTTSFSSLAPEGRPVAFAAIGDDAVAGSAATATALVASALSHTAEASTSPPRLPRSRSRVGSAVALFETRTSFSAGHCEARSEIMRMAIEAGAVDDSLFDSPAVHSDDARVAFVDTGGVATSMSPRETVVDAPRETPQAQTFASPAANAVSEVNPGTSAVVLARTAGCGTPDKARPAAPSVVGTALESSPQTRQLISRTLSSPPHAGGTGHAPRTPPPQGLRGLGAAASTAARSPLRAVGSWLSQRTHKHDGRRRTDAPAKKHVGTAAGAAVPLVAGLLGAALNTLVSVVQGKARARSRAPRLSVREQPIAARFPPSRPPKAELWAGERKGEPSGEEDIRYISPGHSPHRI